MDPHLASVIRRLRAWPRRVLITAAAIVVVLVALRAALPYIVTAQINRRLREIPGYRGSLADVTMNLWRGAYTLNGISVFKQNGHQENPFFLARHIDFSISWRDLLHGKVVSQIYLDHPELTLVKGPTPETTQKDTDRRWQGVIEDLFPVNIQHLEIAHGLVRYVDKTKTPGVDVFIKNMEAVATGLRNRPDEAGQEFPAKVEVEGDSLGGGRLSLLADLEPLARKPHFHLSLKLTGVSLPSLNASLKSIANVEVSRGVFEMVLEAAGRDGAFQGYVKPFFNDLKFENLDEQRENIGARLWERIVAGLAWLVKNKPRDQVGTRIPFQGEFGDSQIGVWATIRNLFRHGFIRAFNPVIEGSVNPDQVPPPSEIAPDKSSGEERRKAERQLERKNDEKDASTPRTSDGAGQPSGR